MNKCVDSVIFQSYENIEIILVDDGSTDNSPAICNFYANSDKRVKVIHKENGGLSDARNHGIDCSSGDYICFVDGDDYLESNYIEKLYNAIIETDSDLAICNFRLVDENGNGLLNDSSPIVNELLDRNAFFEKIEENDGYYYIVAWNKLYSKKVLDSVRFPKGKIHEDEATIHYFANNCNRIVTIEDSLYNYVQRHGSIMSQAFNIKRLDYIDALANRIAFYISIGRTKDIDKLITIQITRFYNFKRYFFKTNPERVKELEKLCKGSIKISKPYIQSFRTRIITLFPSMVPFLTNFYRFLNRHKLPFFSYRVLAFFKRIKKKMLFQKSLEFKEFINEKGKIVFIDTPTHGNLGDQAICESEKTFLKSFYNKRVFEFTHGEWILYKKQIVAGLSSDDTVFLPGGGFIGSLWPNEHSVIVDIIKKAKRSKIVVFPQTIYFSKNDYKNIKEFAHVCINAEKLIIMARDKASYDLLLEMGLNNKVKYAPDIALLYDCPKPDIQVNNSKILLCLRNDKERIINPNDVETLLVQNQLQFDRTSTVLDTIVNSQNRKVLVDKKIKEFSKYSLVITDRLHAMIFAYLAGVSCIAFDNSSKKVSGVFEWIKDTPGFTISNPKSININLINSLRNIKHDISNRFFLYEIIMNALEDCK